MKTHLLRCGMAIALLLSRPLAAQSAPSDPQGAASPNACDLLFPDGIHSDALRKVCLYAVTLPQKMPNFSCEQTTFRYLDGQPADVITGIVTYEDGKESFKEITSNGQPATDGMLLNSGTWSTGQFAGDVQNLFATSNQLRFQFVNESKIDGRPVLTFQYWVERQDVPLWRLHVHDRVVAPPYHGHLWIDKDTGTFT